MARSWPRGGFPALTATPGAVEVATIPLPRPTVQLGQEAFLLVRFVSDRRPRPMPPPAMRSPGRNCRVVLCRPRRRLVRATTATKPLTLTEANGRVGVSGDGFELTFSGDAGLEQLRPGRGQLRSSPRVPGCRSGAARPTTTASRAWLRLPGRGSEQLACRRCWIHLVISPGPRIETTEEGEAIAVRIEQTASCAASPWRRWCSADSYL